MFNNPIQVVNSQKRNRTKDKVSRLYQSLLSKGKGKRSESTVSLRQPIDLIQRNAKQASKL